MRKLRTFGSALGVAIAAVSVFVTTRDARA